MENGVLNIIIIAVLSYFVGSIPTSIIASKISKGIDIRNYGSGNAGGTNSFRVLGWKIGLIVVIADIFKGFASAAWISGINVFSANSNMNEIAPVIAGSAAVIGHCYTVFAGFKGGKGVATTAGMLIALKPITFITCLIVFAITLLASGYVSLGSLLTALSFPVTVHILNYMHPGSVSMPFRVFSIIAAIFVFYTHRSNIKRLIQGKENRFDKLRIFRR